MKRIWRREGLRVPSKQPKRGRLWLNDGSCIRLRPTHGNHVWSYDFVQNRTHDGRAFRMLTVIDEYSRTCLAIHVKRKLNSQDVLHVLGKLFVRHGPPEHIRSDNGHEESMGDLSGLAYSIARHQRRATRIASSPCAASATVAVCAPSTSAKKPR